MHVARYICWITALLLAFCPAQAAPGDKIIPAKDANGHVIFVPHDSPIQFHHFGGKYDPHEAHFAGRFVLTGTFTYGCDIECDPPLKDEDLILAIEPDRAVAARLPHWGAGCCSDMLIYITRERRLIDAITSPKDRARLRSGKITRIEGRISVVVDNFVAGISCDQPVYTARFVSIVRPSARKPGSGGFFGCG